MWMQTLVPGTAIPPHTHGGEEVVIVLKVHPSTTLPSNHCQDGAGARDLQIIVMIAYCLRHLCDEASIPTVRTPP